jgi:Patatin-like phospholipase
VRTRFASSLLAGLAIAAIGAVSVDSYGQPAQRKARVHAGEPASEVPRQKPSAKKSAAQPAAKPSAGQPELTRPEFSAADQAAAQIPGMPDVRFWADSSADFERALAGPAGPWLILSTGGEEGAFGAGFLNGWSASGTRPQFAVITGVSTGALMATYVFAGPQFDQELHQGYTQISASDIFEVAATPESLADAWPLAKLIEKRVTPEILAAVAAEYAKGRRLFVVTTNLDAGRPVVWNMGAIAAHGGEAALKLFRQILLASASIEGLFQPVYITAEANGHQFQEMHADGGASGPLFFGPVPYLMPNATERLPATDLYAVVNGKMSSEFYMPTRNTAGILGRAITVALKAGGRLEIALASLAARRAGIGFNVTYVGDDFDQVGRGLFDPKYMTALYDYGYAKGRADDRFRNPLSLPRSESPTASGGPAPAPAPAPAPQ